MDSLQRAVLATEILADKFRLDPIYLEALKTQSGDPITRLSQQCEAMADVLWEVAKAVESSPPTAEEKTSAPDGEGRKKRG